MVGFNRRFSPLTQRLKKVLAYRKSPLSIIIIVNAGSVSMDSWVQDPGVWRGRILGEDCHFIDLMRYIVVVPIEEVYYVATVNKEKI